MNRFRSSAAPDEKSPRGLLSPRGAWTRARLTALAVTAILSCASTTSANPIPNFLFHVHIHGDDGSLCDSLPIVYCEQIVETTPDLGVLAFDFIAVGYVEDLYDTPMQFTITWPAAWGFVRGEACGSGASVVQQGNRAIFSIQNLNTAPEEWGLLLGMGRLVLNATTPGIVRRTAGPFYDWWSEGQAGTECDDCGADNCDDYFPEHPIQIPSTLELEADFHGQAIGHLYVDHYLFGQGELEFVPQVPWLSIEAAAPGTSCCPAYDVTVLADASTLAAGVHQGDIMTIFDVWGLYANTTVLFTVRNAPEPVEQETWGVVKRRFR